MKYDYSALQMNADFSFVDVLKSLVLVSVWLSKIVLVYRLHVVEEEEEEEEGRENVRVVMMDVNVHVHHFLLNEGSRNLLN